MATNRSAGGGYEIPNEMRDFADKSVEQARKAFDGFLDAAYKASNTLENQANTAQDNVRAVAGAAVSFAEQNMAASFAYAQKLVRATSIGADRDADETGPGNGRRSRSQDRHEMMLFSSPRG